jgi:hypothetical protein
MVSPIVSKLSINSLVAHAVNARQSQKRKEKKKRKTEQASLLDGC